MKQRIVAKSSIKAEYRAPANASKTLWLLSLFKELGLPIYESPKLLHDNLDLRQLSFNLVQHSSIKHIQIDLHFVCDMVRCGILKVRHVNMQDQLADLLTKPLSRQRMKSLRNKISLADGSSILWGMPSKIPKIKLQFASQKLLVNFIKLYV